jgi:hypothetical protein
MRRVLLHLASASWLLLASCASAPRAAPRDRPAPVPPVAPRIQVRRAPIPPPTTLAALLAIYRGLPDAEQLPPELARCQLPSVTPAPEWITLAAPDNGLQLRLPPGWRARPPGTTAFGDPEALLEDQAGGRIRAHRVLTGGEGRESLNARDVATGQLAELPHTGPCQVGDGPAGSLWTLYPAEPGITSGFRSRYFGLGDLVTAGGRRYKVSVSASTAEERDRLVRMVAEAGLATSAWSTPGGV